MFRTGADGVDREPFTVSRHRGQKACADEMVPDRQNVAFFRNQNACSIRIQTSGTGPEQLDDHWLPQGDNFQMRR